MVFWAAKAGLQFFKVLTRLQLERIGRDALRPFGNEEFGHLGTVDSVRRNRFKRLIFQVD